MSTTSDSCPNPVFVFDSDPVDSGRGAAASMEIAITKASWLGKTKANREWQRESGRKYGGRVKESERERERERGTMRER